MRMAAAERSMHWRMIFPKFQRYVEHFHEFVDFDRLGQIAEESRLQSLVDVAGNGVRADGDDRNVSRRLVLAQDRQRLDSADARQVDVHEDDVGPARAGELDA